MKRTSLVVAGFSAMLALSLIGYGCTSGDTVSDGTGGAKGTGGATTGGGQGGATSGGQGGATSGGQGGATSGGQGGATSGGQGGATGGGTGGATGGGTGGATGGGTGGATGGGTGGATGGVAMCPSSVKDKMMCDPTMVTTPCTKNCGINAAGQARAQKPCACIASTVTPPDAWDCTNQGQCVYPATFDKTCFSLTPAPPACPTTLITTGVTTCTNTAGMTCGPLCGSAVTTVNSYQDSSMSPKVGYCACINGIWQCASAKEWPM